MPGKRKSKKRKYECVGGPLCGSMWYAKESFIAVDDDGVPHYYRLVHLTKNDHSAVATYHHYFGTNLDYAMTAKPCLRPGARCFRPAE